jgi:HPt (histidine-containing phosphotransfer) domain-containing protein
LNNSNIFNEIKDALIAGDVASAHRMAHTLKSTAGLIGESSLQKAALDVEGLLRDGLNQVTDNEMDRLATELDSVISKLTSLIKGVEAPAKPLDMDTEKILVLYEKIEPLLRQSKANCLAYIDEIRAIPGNDELVRQMEAFDFDMAVETLENRKKELEGSRWIKQ